MESSRNLLSFNASVLPDFAVSSNLTSKYVIFLDILIAPEVSSPTVGPIFRFYFLIQKLTAFDLNKIAKTGNTGAVLMSLSRK